MLQSLVQILDSTEKGKGVQTVAIATTSAAGVSFGWLDLLKDIDLFLQIAIQGLTVVMLLTVIVLNVTKIMSRSNKGREPDIDES